MDEGDWRSIESQREARAKQNSVDPKRVNMSEDSGIERTGKWSRVTGHGGQANINGSEEWERGKWEHFKEKKLGMNAK